MLRVLLLIGLSLIVACSRATEAESVQLVRLFTADSVEQRWFSDSFAERAKLEKIQRIVDGHSERLESFERVEPSRAGYNVHFAKGHVPVTIHLDQTGKIDGLFFKPAVFAGTNRG